MSQRSHSMPMLAQGLASAGSAVSTGTAHEPRPVLPPEDGSDAAAEAILALLSEKRFHSARRLAAEAAARSGF